MKWQALKEWSISFVIALVPFLLVLGALLVPNLLIFAEIPYADSGQTFRRAFDCDNDCIGCIPIGIRDECMPPQGGVSCGCSTASPYCIHCKCRNVINLHPGPEPAFVINAIKWSIQCHCILAQKGG